MEATIAVSRGAERRESDFGDPRASDVVRFLRKIVRGKAIYEVADATIGPITESTTITMDGALNGQELRYLLWIDKARPPYNFELVHVINESLALGGNALFSRCMDRLLIENNRPCMISRCDSAFALAADFSDSVWTVREAILSIQAEIR